MTPALGRLTQVSHESEANLDYLESLSLSGTHSETLSQNKNETQQNQLQVYLPRVSSPLLGWLHINLTRVLHPFCSPAALPLQRTLPMLFLCGAVA